MSQNELDLDDIIEFLRTDEAIPVISTLLIVLLVFFADIGYYLLETAMMLLFYAVLVRMWTAMTPRDSELLRGPFAHPVFLLISAGAVAMGILIEQWIGSLSGTVLPAQFLAMSVVVSKIYLYIRDSANFRKVLLWENKQDRYVILIPSLVVILLPAVVLQYGISSLLLIDASIFVSRTTSSFLYLTTLGVCIGSILFVVVEEDDISLG